MPTRSPFLTSHVDPALMEALEVFARLNGLPVVTIVREHLAYALHEQRVPTDGRPSQGDGTVEYRFHCQPELHELVRAAAERDGLSVSTWVARVLAERVGEALEASKAIRDVIAAKRAEQRNGAVL
jgi:hypothetical protein